MSFLEAVLENDGRAVATISPLLRPWGGPTLSGLWSPGDPRSRGVPADADSTAWHFRLNRMPIPSSVTNRFLSTEPLPEAISKGCVAPCAIERVPRLYAGGSAFDLLAALNFTSGLDRDDALNRQVSEAVRALVNTIDASAVSWSVEDGAARSALLRFYSRDARWLGELIERLPVQGEGAFLYRRTLPDGQRLEVKNTVIAERLRKVVQPTSSSSSN